MTAQKILDPYQAQLKSDSARERESAAEALADYLQYQEMARDTRTTVGFWLFDALRHEKSRMC